MSQSPSRSDSRTTFKACVRSARSSLKVCGGADREGLFGVAVRRETESLRNLNGSVFPCCFSLVEHRGMEALVFVQGVCSVSISFQVVGPLS